jgi:DNA replication protein DnaC
VSDGPTASPPEGFPGSADLRPASAERFGAFPGDAGGPATGAGAFPHARDLRGAGAERCPLGVCDGSGFVIDEQTNTASDCGCRAGRVAGARTRNLAGRIPKRYQGVSFDRPPVSDILRTAPDQIRSVRRYVQSIRENLDAGRGLWIQGDVGTGKTTLAMLVSKAALDAGRSVAIYSLPRLLNLLRESMNSEHGMLDFMDRLTAVDLLHLDDLGAENQTDWVLEQLYSIVNARYEAERAIIATTNLPPDELGMRLGDRTVSRLVEICGDPITLAGEDRRREYRVRQVGVAAPGD